MRGAGHDECDSRNREDTWRPWLPGYGSAIAIVACGIVTAALIACWNAFRPMLEYQRARTWSFALDAYFDAHGSLPQITPGQTSSTSSTITWRETLIADPATRRALREIGTPTSPAQYGTICAIVHPESVWGNGTQQAEQRARDRSIVALYSMHSSDPPHPMSDIIIDGGKAHFRMPGGTTKPVDILDDVFVIALGGRVRFVQDPISGDGIANFLLAPFEE